MKARSLALVFFVVAVVGAIWFLGGHFDSSDPELTTIGPSYDRAFPGELPHGTPVVRRNVAEPVVRKEGAQQPGNSVVVVLEEGTGNSIRGATVSIVKVTAAGKEELAAKKVTDAHGTVDWSEAAAQEGKVTSYYAVAQHDGFRDASEVVSPGERVVVMLERGARIFGRLMYTDNHPVAHERLGLFSRGATTGMIAPRRSTKAQVDSSYFVTTDAEGYFCFRGLNSSRRYWLEVARKGIYVVSKTREPLRPMESPYTYYVHPTACLDVELVDQQSGAGIALGAFEGRLLEVKPTTSGVKILDQGNWARAGFSPEFASGSAPRRYVFLDCAGWGQGSLSVDMIVNVAGFEPHKESLRIPWGASDPTRKRVLLRKKRGWVMASFVPTPEGQVPGPLAVRIQTHQTVELSSVEEPGRTLRYDSVPIDKDGVIRGVAVPVGQWKVSCYGTPSGRESTCEIRADGEQFAVFIESPTSLEIRPQATDGFPLRKFVLKRLWKGSVKGVPIVRDSICRSSFVLQYAEPGPYFGEIATDNGNAISFEFSVKPKTHFICEPVIE